MAFLASFLASWLLWLLDDNDSTPDQSEGSVDARRLCARSHAHGARLWAEPAGTRNHAPRSLCCRRKTWACGAELARALCALTLWQKRMVEWVSSQALSARDAEFLWSGHNFTQQNLRKSSGTHGARGASASDHQDAATSSLLLGLGPGSPADFGTRPEGGAPY